MTTQEKIAAVQKELETTIDPVTMSWLKMMLNALQESQS